MTDDESRETSRGARQDPEETMPPGGPEGSAPEGPPVVDGRYELLEHVGRGSSGIVYRARDRQIDEIVALKVLRRDRGGDSRSLGRLRREVKLARRVTHRNVARIYDLRVEGSKPYLTMEFVEGRTLRDILADRQQLSLADCVDYLEPVCRALQAAHRVRIVHRDLKPENVLVEPGGRVVVTDFGLAVPSGALDEEEAGMVGTPHYIAPEQVDGAKVDGRADIYAVGVMLYRMIAGRYPWQADKPVAIVLERIDQPPPSLPDGLEVPTGLEAVLERSLAPDPGERYGDALAFLEDLQAVLARESLAATGEIGGAAEERRTNLEPLEGTFVGRREEQSRLAEIFDRGEDRLVTLMGPGGTGKTRLARKFGLDRVEAVAGGVWFCDLTEAESVADICRVVAGVLDVPLTQDDPVAQLGRALDGRGEMLLVLDNVEQIVEPVVEVLERWLATAGGMSVLATSRVRLGLEAEQVFGLATLPTDDAVTLFERRARQVRPHFRLTDDNRADVEAIVEQVDGLALAVEMAAARVRLLDVAQLRERLAGRLGRLRSSRRDRPERHRTMEAVIDGSWALLSEEARLALAQFSVFRGGASLEDACQIVDLSGLGRDVWPEEALEELWDHSLLRWRRTDEGTRLSLLETVRVYAEVVMAKEGAVTGVEGASLTGTEAEHALRDRHADWFARLGEEEEMRALHREGGVARRRRLARELENIIAAHGWAVEREDPVLAVRATRAAWEVFSLQGPFERALELIEDAGELEGLSEELRGRVDRLAGAVQTRLGRYEEAETSLGRAREAAWRAGDRYAEGVALANFASLEQNRGNLDEAGAYFREALDAHRDVGDRRREGSTLASLAVNRMHLGSLDEAADLYDRAIEKLEAMGNSYWLGVALGNRGIVYDRRGELERAADCYHRALELHREVGNVRSSGIVSSHLGILYYKRGEFERAIEYYERSLEVHRRVGNRRSACFVLGNLGATLAEMERLEEARENLERAIELAEEWSLGRPEGSFRGTLANLLRRQGEFEEARRQFRLAEEVLRDLEVEHELGEVVARKGLLLAEQDEREAAEACLEEARTLLERVGAGPESEFAELIGDLEESLGADEA